MAMSCSGLKRASMIKEGVDDLEDDLQRQFGQGWAG
jgi:hypothetical protein